MESEFIRWLAERIPSHPCLHLGVGDDAAIVRIGGQAQCVITTDVVMDGVDFKLSEINPRRAGRKALAVNLSDLAAMAAHPIAAVVGLVLPKAQGWDIATALYEGMLPLAEKYNVAIAGGDTNSWDGPLAVSVTAFGQPTAAGSLKRSGARPGDRILVTGSFGGSILHKHLDFEPRVTEALLLNERCELHAGIDCSDGLALDLSRICQASGCGAEIQLERVPIAEDALRWAMQLADGSAALDHALGDGEDFELILAVPPDDARRLVAEQPLAVRLTDIGSFVPEPGLWQIDPTGKRAPLKPRGFQHDFS